MAGQELQMGWFLPTSGDTSAMGDPSQHIPNSLEHFARVGAAAEDAGFEYVLCPTSAQCWDAWITAAFVAARTSRLKFLVALKPGYIHPVQLARMVGTFDQISGGGRILINLIAGLSAAETAAEGQLESKELRYEQMEEEIRFLQRLLSEDGVAMHGKYYHVDKPTLPVRAMQKPHPPFFLGGGSDMAAEISAKYSSTHLFWGDYPEKIAEEVKKLRERAARHGREGELRFSMRLQVICRETEAEAWDFAEQLVANTEARRAMLESRKSGFDSVANSRQFELAAAAKGNKLTPHLWTGMTAVRQGGAVAVVGTPDQVVGQLREFIDAGCSGFCLSGFPHVDEAQIFGKYVMPLLRRQAAGA